LSPGGKLFQTIWEVASLGTDIGDSDEERVRKAILTLVGGCIAILAIFWGSLYVVLGFPYSGAIPLSYAVISFISIAYFFGTKRFRFFRFSQLFLIFWLPFLLQISLGGFAKGSVVMIWAFFAPLAALLFADTRHATKWLIAYLAMIAVCGVLDIYPPFEVRPMPPVYNTAFFIMNMGAGSALIYLAISFFTRDREKTHQDALQAKRALEDANRNLQQSETLVRELMMTDPLTGIPNRRSLEERLDYELERQKRFGGDLAVVITDIDFFKRVNDRYGHTVGDDMLTAFASLLSEQIRATDFVARFGGEEFILVLPDTGKSGAVELTERIRRLLSNRTIPPLTKPLTASFGIAVVVAGEDKKSAVSRADRALYNAKQNGRNRITVAD
jgi:diguanylate cyclase (GGDEF)-like protein